MDDKKSPTIISALAVFSVFLALVASMWRLWNWPILGAIIIGKITPIIPQIQATERGALRIFGVNATIFLYITILAGAAILIVVRRFQARDRRFWIAILPPILIMLLAGLSASWSVTPAQTYAQLLPFVVFTLAGPALGLASREKEILSALEIFSIVVILASILALLRYPTGATMIAQHTLAWRGIFLHKNILGLVMVLANLAFLLRLLDFRRQHWLLGLSRLGLFALTLFILMKANAKASLVALLAIYFLLALGYAYLKWGHRLKRGHWILATCAGVAGLFLLWLARQPILDILGRSSALTGRIPLWSRLVPYIVERPLLGYGFGEAFWAKYRPSIVLGRGWHPPHAHNAFVDFVLALGFVGLALVLILILEVFGLGIRYFLRVRSALSTWPLLILALIVVISMAESFLASNTYFLWTLLLLTFGFVLRAALAPAEPAPASTSASALAPVGSPRSI